MKKEQDKDIKRDRSPSKENIKKLLNYILKKDKK